MEFLGDWMPPPQFGTTATAGGVNGSELGCEGERHNPVRVSATSELLILSLSLEVSFQLPARFLASAFSLPNACDGPL
jgi:hypothetical protein